MQLIYTTTVHARKTVSWKPKPYRFGNKSCRRS